MFSTSFSVYHLEYYLMIFARIAGTLSLAPIFSHKAVPVRVRLFLSLAIAMVVVSIRPYTPLDYTTIMGFTAMLIKELVVGLTIGFLANITMNIITMAGEFIDREIGFTMVSNFDPTVNTSVTITAELYNYSILLIMLGANLHYFFITAVVDSFNVIPIGKVIFNAEAMYSTVLGYIAQYFIIALRISLPMFVSILLLNVILGILAKVAPQMNMFAVGIQLKVLAGLFVVLVTIGFLPNITDFLFTEAKDIIYEAIRSMY